MKYVLSIILFISTLSFAADTTQKAIIETSKGNIEIELFVDKAPKSVANFVEYAKSGFYTDTVFHRVISGFMIQGGGMMSDMTKKATQDSIENEADNGELNKRGTLAMARTSAPHSATSQFFINLVDNDFLNFKSKDSGQTWGYAVFGKVTNGMDIVDEIGAVKTGMKDGHRDVPTEAITILSVKLIDEEAEEKVESVEADNTEASSTDTSTD